VTPVIARVTSLHLRALTLVHHGRIIWCARTGPCGGFRYADGSAIPPGNGLVSLYELRHANLITVDKPHGRVALTMAGHEQLVSHRPPEAVVSRALRQSSGTDHGTVAGPPLAS
jgi:hypothetical protein